MKSTIYRNLPIWVACMAGMTSSALMAQMTDPAPRTEQVVNWTVGDIRADPATGIVYLLDESSHRLMALDTASGLVSASVVVEHSVRGGRIEFSIDGTRIHLSTPDTNRIFTFEKAGLAAAGSIEVPYSVKSFVAGSDGFFYTAGKRGSDFRLFKVDSADGMIAGEIPISSATSSVSLIRNSSGSRIFVTKADVSTASGSTQEFAVTAGQMPSAVATHFPDATGEKRIVIDENLNRLYRPVASGVGVWTMPSGNYTAWSHGGYFSGAVAHAPGSGIVVGASGDISDAVIRKFNRDSGSAVYTYPISSSAGYFDARLVEGAVVTSANGSIVYVKKNVENQYCVGLIGSSNLSLPAMIPPTTKPHSENRVTWSVGDMLGDPVRNLVYVVDETNRKLIAFNTGTGNADADLDLPLDPSGGKLALSLDSNTLYLSAPSVGRMLSFSSVPTLSLLGNLSLAAPLRSFVQASDGSFYGQNDGDLLRIDPANGTVTGTLDNVVYSQGGLIRRDESGTRLYLLEEGLSGGAGVDEYEVRSGEMPLLVGASYSTISNDRDLSVDRGRNQLYRASGGIYGIGVRDMGNEVENFWPFGVAYGTAVAQHPGLPSVFGASGSNLILEFEKDTAKVLGTYDLNNFPTGFSNAIVIQDRMEVGANGVAVYARRNVPGEMYIGAIGLGSIELPRRFTGPPPAAATGLTASDGSQVNQVVVFWNGSAGAEYYRVFRHTANDPASASQIGVSVAAVSYVDRTATPGTPYYYWVKAVNQGGASDFSNVDTGFAREAPPAPPASVSASDGEHEDRIVVTWAAVPAANQYRVYSATHAAGPYSLKSSVLASVNSFADTSASRGVVHHYRVESVTNAGGASVPSPSDSGYRRILPPSALTASDGMHQGETRLGWSSVSGASSYKIFRGTQPDGSGASQIGSSSSNAFADTSVQAGFTYFYFVVARVGDIESGMGVGDAGFGTVGEPFRPDALVGLGATAMIGDQVYAKGPSQELRQVSKKLKGLRWYFRAENDGETDDRITVRITPGDRLFSASLRTAGGENITAGAVTASVPRSLGGGASETYVFDVKPSKKLRGKVKSKSFELNLRSTSDTSLSDTAIARADTAKK